MTKTRREFLSELGKAGACLGFWESSSAPLRGGGTELVLFADPPQDPSGLKAAWLRPARTYRPHTRWWWPGGAVTSGGITWELEQMSAQGMGGVEIMIPWVMYAQGNIEFLSDEWLEVVKHAVREAARLDMEVAITFSPGWCFGGYWVPPTERSKVLTRAWVDVSGPRAFNQPLPAYAPPDSAAAREDLPESFLSDAPDENSVVAAVAGEIAGPGLNGNTLIDLSDQVSQNRLDWQVPSGQWRLMVFRLKYTGQQNSTTENFLRRQWVVDHFSQEAVTKYCDYLGGKLYQAFGEEFGRTVDSMFCDSFEIMALPDTIHWSNAALEQFKNYKGYDLKRYLPAIWWDIGELTRRIRYDINDFLCWLGLHATFMPFINWCNGHNVEARIQPYFRFTNEVIQGAGVTPRPEMEVTTDRFAVVLNPRKAVAAGAHLYGRRIVSAEAFTYLHTERYRSTLEEMKGATDAFLRDGVTQFYNHGYIYSPEMHVAPSRDMPWANRISHWNTWWKYYRHLADYTSRCCLLLRQGEFAGDVLIYSPQSTVWTEKVLFGNYPQFMPYGELGKTLVANGYDFDPVNDDILQNRARVEDGRIKVRDLAYRFLILPKTTAVPVATMEFVRQFALGGGVVIALDELPSESVGLKDATQHDTRVKEIVTELFGPDGKGMNLPGEGRTYFIASYKIPRYDTSKRPFYQVPEPYQPTPAPTAPQRALLEALREHLAPDFELAGNLQSNGLTFLHRRLGSEDLYFVTNLQLETSETAVTFRVNGKIPERWDPMTGEIAPVLVYRTRAAGVEIPIRLPARGSLCILFRAGQPQPHLTETNLEEVRDLTERQVEGTVSHNGEAHVTVVTNGQSKTAQALVSGLPEPLAVSGAWRMTIEGYRFERLQEEVTQLKSWTEDPRTKHFSGTGRYELDFEVPGEYVGAGLDAVLDLGRVGDVAEVILNRRAVGVGWMQPYHLDVTESIRAGANHLEVLVTNTLINYVSGLTTLPEVPEELVPHYGKTTDIYSLGTTAWKEHEKNFHPLPPSGLMGPVRIVARRKVALEL
jgi:(4-O-methyl)-D-glucuronate---lignin esterase